MVIILRANKNLSRNESVIIGQGYIVRRFPDAFIRLLTTQHNEGTPFGKFFNELDSEGRSTIYIKQPKYEDILSKIIDADTDSFKYLIGFPGIGKTTLLKNFFKSLRRDIEIYDGKVIIYISFQTDNVAENEFDMTTRIIQYIKLAIDKLRVLFDDIDPIMESEMFWELLYGDIERNKPSMLQVDEIIPGKDTSIRMTKIERLNEMRIRTPLAYYTFLLKYLVNRSKSVNRIVYIFDDLETQDASIQRSIIKNAEQIFNCSKTEIDRTYWVKAIVSLRSLTFQEHMGSDKSAKRVLIKNSVILKEDIPDISEIFNRRFEAAIKKDFILADSQKMTDWETAYEILLKVSNELGLKFGRLISKLTNHDIFQALDAFVKIVTNHRYFAQFEEEEEGAFTIRFENYNLATTEPAFKALLLGESDVFVPTYSDIICNILHSHYEEESCCELLGLYIIQYMMKSRRMGGNNIYGTSYKIGNDIVNEICSVFEVKDSEEYLTLKHKLNYMITHLYRGKIIQRSIYDYEDSNENARLIEQQYKGEYALYLSFRGIEQFEQLSDNSMMYELFRDDIDSDIFNAINKSSEMSFFERMEFLVTYTHFLFREREREYILRAITQNKLEMYLEYFDDRFITSRILEGVTKSVLRYYKSKGSEYNTILSQIDNLVYEMSDYSSRLEKEQHIKITPTEFFITPSRF